MANESYYLSVFGSCRSVLVSAHGSLVGLMEAKLFFHSPTVSGKERELHFNGLSSRSFSRSLRPRLLPPLPLLLLSFNCPPVRLLVVGLTGMSLGIHFC